MLYYYYDNEIFAFISLEIRSDRHLKHRRISVTQWWTTLSVRLTCSDSYTWAVQCPSSDDICRRWPRYPPWTNSPSVRAWCGWSIWNCTVRPRPWTPLAQDKWKIPTCSFSRSPRSAVPWAVTWIRNRCPRRMSGIPRNPANRYTGPTVSGSCPARCPQSLFRSCSVPEHSCWPHPLCRWSVVRDGTIVCMYRYALHL